MISFLVIIAISYLLGSIPAAIWVGKISQGIDIREHGSGNAGTTNVFRVLGWKAGVVVGIIDFGKGFVAAYYVSTIGFTLGEMPATLNGWSIEVFMRILAGAASVGGHMFPLFAGFSGGKGVLTAAGMLMGVEPVSISIALTVFIIVLLTTRYVSLASIIASAFYPILLVSFRYIFGWMEIDGSMMVFGGIVASGIIIKHIPNIKRLVEGNENRIQSFAPSKGKFNEENQT